MCSCVIEFIKLDEETDTMRGFAEHFFFGFPQRVV